mgnify:CR=1 FL=1
MSKTTRLAHTMENLSLLKVEMAKKDIKYLNETAEKVVKIKTDI